MTLPKPPLKTKPVKAHSNEERENLLNLLSECSDFIFTIKNNLKGYAFDRANELEALTNTIVKHACSQ